MSPEFLIPLSAVAVIVSAAVAYGAIRQQVQTMVDTVKEIKPAIQELTVRVVRIETRCAHQQKHERWGDRTDA